MSPIRDLPIKDSGAVFSPCQAYRYSLWRVWNAQAPKVLFIGLNPSTADAENNDPTIRRCIGFANEWGYGGVYVANLFSWRSPHPRLLKQAAEPIGEHTNDWLVKLNDETDLTIACWGNNGSFQHRDIAVMGFLKGLHCLRMTKQGNPSHPLYLPKHLAPIRFNPNLSCAGLTE
ncbi:MAG: DUF1643 domain-containing protein [Cyanobacteria bacterium J06627_8]